ncbi:hypothetical protein EGW08_018617, partial [Elysia chlorotica]
MARTKKQTLENASERKRLIQEEILRESLAAKPKTVGDTSQPSAASPSARSRIKGKHRPRYAKSSLNEMASHASPMSAHTGTPVATGASSSRRRKAEAHRATGQEKTVSSLSEPRKTAETSSSNKGDMPKAVLCIPDIYSSPSSSSAGDFSCKSQDMEKTPLAASDFGTVSTQLSSGAKKESAGNSDQGKHKTKRELQDSEKASLKSLKAASELVREEKRRTSRKRSPGSSKEESPGSENPSPERRSPRRQSPSNSSDSAEQHQQLSNTGKSKGKQKTQLEERPKINIFTDNIGVELGKRVRSPRRLSEDMIALPIFSVRRWSTSPREVSYIADKSDGDVAATKSPVEESESFKAPPAVSPNSLFNKGLGNISAKKRNSSNEKTQSLSSTTFDDGDKQNSTPVRNVRAKKLKSKVLPLTPEANKTRVNVAQGSSPTMLLKKKKSNFNPQNETSLKEDMVMTDNPQSEPQEKTEEGTKHEESLQKSLTKKSKSKSLVRTASGEKKKKQREKMKIGDEVLTSICRDIMSGVVISPGGCQEDDVQTKLERICPVGSEQNQTCSKESMDSSKNQCSSYIPVALSPSSNQAVSTEISMHKNPITTLNVESEESKSMIQASCVTVKETVNAISPCLSSKDSPQSSLLCAMLVGGSEVAHTYEKSKPAVGGAPVKLEANDEHTSSPLVSPSTSAVQLSQSQIADNLVEERFDSSAKTLESVDESNCELLSEKGDAPSLDILETISSKEAPGNSNILRRDLKQDVNGTVKKDLKIDIASKLKGLDETVLKLLDIDVEEAFLGSEYEEARSLNEIEEKGEETPLYGVIANLAGRLKDEKLSIDIEEVLNSCPKHMLKICSHVDEAARWNSLKLRLKEEIIQESENFAPTKLILSELPINDESCHSNDKSMLTSNKVEEKIVTEGPCDKRGGEISPQMTNSSSNNNSLCDLDPEAMTSAIKEACMEVSANNLEYDVKGIKQKTVEPHSAQSLDSIQESPAKRLIQKSKTFELPVPVPYEDQPIPLRRINSSPQLIGESSHESVLTPDFLLERLKIKDQHVKSKLGSKIPVPGTSYASKSSGKTWRTPRIILQPKPLTVLTELEESSASEKNIFTCPNLQKYLNVPSNRVIVPPHKRKEMQILDEKAQKDAEDRAARMAERSDKERAEEMIHLEYLKYEPDFDEIDGLLFMSFSCEAELTAHGRVEKALEWDKDDTMLRIAQAKAFEEAKQLKSSMEAVKFKHLRGQHMRWKKYRRLYSNEVKSILNGTPSSVEEHLRTEAASKAISRKTSDVMKIKNWRSKTGVARQHLEIRRQKARELRRARKEKRLSAQKGSPTPQVSSYSSPPDLLASRISQEPPYTEAGTSGMFSPQFNKSGVESGSEIDASLLSRSKRRAGFSHQKEHKQLFKELDMDWEDRMIHRKLGGWSLKGNRPKAFSQAAHRREEKQKMLLVEEVPSTTYVADTNPPSSGDIYSPASSNTPSRVSSAGDVSSPPKDDGDSLKKKKPAMKLVYPLVTRVDASHILQTDAADKVPLPLCPSRVKCEAGVDQTTLSSSSLAATAGSPALSNMSKYDNTVTPSSSVAANVNSSVPSSPTPTMSQLSSATNTPTAFLASTDIKEDVMVMEGVDTQAISSPSIADSASTKSCGKPGCRYGCICHLCLLSAPSTSPISKALASSCDKEYCRLGCICDSLDPERPIPEASHCGLPSCMLACTCSSKPTLGRGSERGENIYGHSNHYLTFCVGPFPSASNDNDMDSIPFLPSMKRRPKPTDRFSNLPQRQRTHRSAKNLDAITRKAMMLYETSEIYCEKTERPPRRDQKVKRHKSGFNSFTLRGAYFPLITKGCMTISIFIFVLLLVNQFLYIVINTRNGMTISTCILFKKGISLILLLPLSSLYRKRKSHPLSGEIFTFSSSARTQPYNYKRKQQDQGRSLLVADSATSYLMRLAPIQPKPHSHSKSSSGQSSVSEQSALTVYTAASSLSEVSPAVSEASVAQKNAIQTQVSPQVHSKSVQHIPTPASLYNPNSQSLGFGKGTSRNRYQQPWHTSMVCLKARGPPPKKKSDASQPTADDEGDEEDVKEEDEVKLLEFLANCNWEGARKEILGRVAQCLSRGQYPQPRTMNICEFLVEILPKAHKPSVIPEELRKKLPGKMYSIRVRVTRREILPRPPSDMDTQVIDLSDNSPMKINHGVPAATTGTLQTSSQQALAVSRVPRISSNVGISGLSRMCVTSKNDFGNDQLKSSSAPNSRRTSTEVTTAAPLSDAPSLIQVKRKGATLQANFNIASDESIQADLENGKGFVNSSVSLTSPCDAATVTTSANHVLGTSVTSSVSTLPFVSEAKPLQGNKTHIVRPIGNINSSARSLLTSPSISPLTSDATSTTGIVPLLCSVNSNDVKYMKIQGKDRLMQIVGMKNNKTLVTVPLSVGQKLAAGDPQKLGASNTCNVPFITVPICGPGGRKVVPIIPSPLSTQ